MSHEMRTPLHGVIGLSLLLRRECLGTRVETLTGKIHDSAAALARIVDEILDMRAIESGAVTIDARSFDVTGLVDAACAPFEAEAHEKGIALSARCSPDVGPMLHGDDQRLRQVLQNLLGNAIKFTDSGAVQLVVEPGGPGLVRFIVSDTGIGIDPTQIGRIFERFYQGDDTSTRRHGGTGLGLTICRELAALMGGAITAHSQPGEGSTFTLVLPLAQVAREAAGPARAPVEGQSARSA